MAKTESEILQSIKNGTYTVKDGEEFINRQRRILGIKEIPNPKSLVTNLTNIPPLVKYRV
jgi:hypothetical protein